FWKSLRVRRGRLGPGNRRGERQHEQRRNGTPAARPLNGYRIRPEASIASSASRAFGRPQCLTCPCRAWQMWRDLLFSVGVDWQGAPPEPSPEWTWESAPESESGALSISLPLLRSM